MECYCVYGVCGGDVAVCDGSHSAYGPVETVDVPDVPRLPNELWVGLGSEDPAPSRSAGTIVVGFVDIVVDSEEDDSYIVGAYYDNQDLPKDKVYRVPPEVEDQHSLVDLVYFRQRRQLQIEDDLEVIEEHLLREESRGYYDHARQVDDEVLLQVVLDHLELVHNQDPLKIVPRVELHEYIAVQRKDRYNIESVRDRRG